MSRRNNKKREDDHASNHLTLKFIQGYNHPWKPGLKKIFKFASKPTNKASAKCKQNNCVQVKHTSARACRHMREQEKLHDGSGV